MGVLIVRVITTAFRLAAVILAFQLAVATDVVVTVVDFTATTAMRSGLVGLISTASVVCTVLLVKNFLVRTTEMGARVVGNSTAAARVLSRQRMGHTTTTPVVSLVVNVSIAATRVVVVALTYTESVVTGWHVAGL